jgi:hypothetical protein
MLTNWVLQAGWVIYGTKLAGAKPFRTYFLLKNSKITLPSGIFLYFLCKFIQAIGINFQIATKSLFLAQFTRYFPRYIHYINQSIKAPS